VKDNFVPVARQKDLVVQEVPGELLVYDLASNRAYCLNATAASIWKLCSGERTLDDIRLSWMEQNQTAIDIDVIRYGVQELASSELLETSVPASGLSRREVIRRIGLASAVALPVIASVVAPKNALSAVSCTCIIALDCLNQVTCQSTTVCNVSGICAPNVPQPAKTPDQTQQQQRDPNM